MSPNVIPRYARREGGPKGLSQFLSDPAKVRDIADRVSAPPGIRTSLCHRCVTLLSAAVEHFGDGFDVKPLLLRHSTFQSSDITCPICRRARLVFEKYRSDISTRTDRTLQPASTIPIDEWTWGWEIEELLYWRKSASGYQSEVEISFWVKHDSVDLLEGVNISSTGNSDNPGVSVGSSESDESDDSGDVDGQIGSVKDRHGFWHTLGKCFVLSTTDDKGSSSVLTPLRSGDRSTIAAAVPDAQLIQGWLSDCIAGHKDCQVLHSRNHDWYPDRLIYYDQTGDSPKFRLVQRSSTADKALIEACRESSKDHVRYIALSHCWGPPLDASKPHGGRNVLTKANLSLWCSQLPLSELGKTHVDSLDLMVRTGTNLMWIDSMCIIQDSVDDWLAQSAVMGDVYKYATLTFAILSGNSDEDGFCFQPGDPQDEFGFLVDLLGILGQLEQHKGREDQQVLLRNDTKFIWQEVHEPSEFPLHQRAWVYQERQLSRRTVGIASTYIAWACDVARGSQHYSRGPLEGSRIRRYQADARNDQLDSYGRKSIAFLESWHESAFEYLTCALTVQSDKVLAISAIARELAGDEHFMGDYLAGLWEHDLWPQLEWTYTKIDPAARRALRGELDYLAPSWSWLSVTGTMTLSYSDLMLDKGEELVRLGEVLRGETTKRTDFEFGPVTSGFLHVRGQLRPVCELKAKPHLTTLQAKDAATGAVLHITPDTADVLSLDITGSGNLYWLPHHIYVGMDDDLHVPGLLLIEDETEPTNLSTDLEQDLECYRRLGKCVCRMKLDLRPVRTRDKQPVLRPELAALLEEIAEYDGPDLHDIEEWDLDMDLSDGETADNRYADGGDCWELENFSRREDEDVEFILV